jgi:GTP-binding protein
VHYKDLLINIVDTPGHADFGGEVERTPSMTRRDAAGGLVRGPLPDAFVLRRLRALAAAAVVINKIDRLTRARRKCSTRSTISSIDLDASEEQLEFPALYTNARPARRA